MLHPWKPRRHIFEQNVEVKLTGAMEGTATVRAVTNDPKAALADTQLVICCTISNLDEQTARFIAPHLVPGERRADQRWKSGRADLSPGIPGVGC